MDTLQPWMKDGASLGVAFAIVYHMLALREVTAFTRSRSPAHASVPFTPPVTLLKPLVDWNHDVVEDLGTFCRQRYSTYQVLLGVADMRDPPTMQEVQTMFPDQDIEVVLSHEGLGANPKVNELLYLYPRVKYDVLVLSDADMRVDPTYITQVVEPLHQPQVGVVTCLYRVREVLTLPAAIEALMINVDFVPGALIGRRLLGLKFAFGATIVLPRQVLEAIGGFEALADYLADDYQIGLRARQAGYQVVLSDYLVENRLPAMSAMDLLRHQIRWARTYRICQPAGWFFSILGHLTIWTLLWLILDGFSTDGWALVSLAVGFRWLEAWFINLRLDGLRTFWRLAWWMPLKDLFSVVIWILSFTGNRVYWAGKTFQVGWDGRMWQIQ